MKHPVDSPRYSFVLPVYNEEETLPKLFEKLSALTTQLDGGSEILLVDDGSRDRTAALCTDQCEKDPRFKFLALSRNFGHQIAITAGMDHAQGEATIVMDADLQDPPEVVLEMIAKWKQGFEVVYAIRKDRDGETWFKLFTAKLFYRLLDRLTDIEIPMDTGDFRLVDRKALDAFKSLREKNRFVRGMFSWVGFKQTGITYNRQTRFAGETKYPFRKMLRLAKNAVVSFSDAPLRMTLNLGLFISVVSFCAGILSLYLKLTGAYTVRGWTSIMLLVSFLGGMQLVVLGVLGEYIGRIYDEVKNRPLYFVRRKKGLD